MKRLAVRAGQERNERYSARVPSGRVSVLLAFNSQFGLELAHNLSAIAGAEGNQCLTVNVRAQKSDSSITQEDVSSPGMEGVHFRVIAAIDEALSDGPRTVGDNTAAVGIVIDPVVS